MLKYATTCADPVQRCYDDFDLFLDRMHALFDEMEQNLSLAPGDASLQHAKLVVHEWLANLIQHADFGGRTPEILLNVLLRGSQVQITIRDNSEGFDLDRQLTVQQETLSCLPNRGMGLLTIQACTQDFSYRCLGPHQHCFAFTVSAGQQPVLNLPLFPFDLCRETAAAAA